VDVDIVVRVRKDVVAGICVVTRRVVVERERLVEVDVTVDRMVEVENCNPSAS